MEQITQARALRLRYKIPLAELARAAGVSIQSISRFELEKERQSARHEALLRDAFRAVIAERRGGLDDLERELTDCFWLFQETEGGTLDD